jgi:hypothetical protein
LPFSAPATTASWWPDRDSRASNVAANAGRACANFPTTGDTQPSEAVSAKQHRGPRGFRHGRSGAIRGGPPLSVGTKNRPPGARGSGGASAVAVTGGKLPRRLSTVASISQRNCPKSPDRLWTVASKVEQTGPRNPIPCHRPTGSRGSRPHSSPFSDSFRSGVLGSSCPEACIEPLCLPCYIVSPARSPTRYGDQGEAHYLE